MMVIHDAEVVDKDLKILSPSLWNSWNFKYQDFEMDDYRQLLKSNVVQGAACAFKKNILKSAFPFPTKAYHDEWLGLNALAWGKIEICDMKLLKYRQTGFNQVGLYMIGPFDKIKKWIANTASASSTHREILYRQLEIWQTLCERYPNTLIIGGYTIKEYYSFLIGR